MRQIIVPVPVKRRDINRGFSFAGLSSFDHIRSLFLALLSNETREDVQCAFGIVLLGVKCHLGYVIAKWGNVCLWSHIVCVTICTRVILFLSTLSVGRVRC